MRNKTPFNNYTVLRHVSPTLPTTIPPPHTSASRGLLESMVEKATKEADSELAVEMVLRESLKEAEYVVHCLALFMIALLMCMLLCCPLYVHTVCREWSIPSRHACTVYT